MPRKKTFLIAILFACLLVALALSACASPLPSVSSQASSLALSTRTGEPFTTNEPDRRGLASGQHADRGAAEPPEEATYATPPLASAVPPRPSPVRPPTRISPTATPQPTEAPAAPVVTYSSYVVRNGDTLTDISARTGVAVNTIIQLNALRNPDHLEVGQVLRIGTSIQPGRAPSDKVIPDSEAVYSPAYKGFDTVGFARKSGGYLAGYREVVEGMELSGPQIVQLVAERFSVGPRLLLTILEMESGWVTRQPANNNELNFPMGYLDASWSGLYRQLWFAADKLNEGYYAQYYKSLNYLTLLDGTKVTVSNQLNPGTAAVLDFLAYSNGYDSWRKQTGSAFTQVYKKLFGDPFARAIEPLVPSDLKQPTLTLPWEPGHTWYFTGGPHGGWADGSAWAAVDFAPDEGNGTCIPSREFAVAVAPGRIVQVENGRVLESLSGEDFPGSGWSILYMHMASADRVREGTTVKVGDHIGRPSCEGGASQADHLHIARLYNGQWIAAADQVTPFVMAGWKVQGGGREYNGTILNGSASIDACNCRAVGVNGVLAVPQTASNNDGPDTGSSLNAGEDGPTVPIAGNNLLPASGTQADTRQRTPGSAGSNEFTGDGISVTPASGQNP